MATQFGQSEVEMYRPKDKKAARKNWWHYYKWYVVTGIVVLIVLFRLIAGALGLFEVRPDLQIAYVAASPLSDEAIADIEAQFADLIGDINADGRVKVRVSSYVTYDESVDQDAMTAAYGTQIQFIGDISGEESYLILTDDPETFQLNWFLLAEADGSEPTEGDFKTEGKVFAWGDSQILSAMDIAGTEGLYVGRRYYSQGSKTDPSIYEAFWNRIKP